MSIPVLERDQQVGPYRVVRFLGEGGMGAVYEAVHVEINRRVALKTLRKEVENLPTVAERFLREGRAAASIRHPHVVDVLDAGQADGVAFLVMEFLEGEDLETLLRRETRLSMERALDILVPVMAAVAEVHQKGIVHRDLKPQNIFLSKGHYGELMPKVLDFGISKVGQDANLTSAGEALGSPNYMSPEQARGSLTVDARSDQFALGVILYETLTGVRPFDAPNALAVLVAIQTETPVPLKERLPGLPEAIDAAVARAMTRDPSKRFDSVKAFGKAVLPFAGPRTRVLWEPLFGSTAAAEELDEEPPPQEDRTVVRMNPFAEPQPPAKPPPEPKVPTGSVKPSARQSSPSIPAPRIPTGSIKPPSRPSSPSMHAAQGSAERPVMPRVPTGSMWPTGKPPASATPPKPTSGAARMGTPLPKTPGRAPAPPPPSAPLPRQRTGAALPARSSSPSSPPILAPKAPPRFAPTNPYDDPPDPEVDRPTLAERRKSVSEMAAVAATGSAGPAQLVIVPASDPAAAQKIKDLIQVSGRLLMLFEFKGAGAPERKPPLEQIMESAGAILNVVVLSDDGRRNWRDPMFELCRDLAPQRPDARFSYLFFEHGALVHAVRKGATSALADAEKVTEWLAQHLPGAKKFKR